MKEIGKFFDKFNNSAVQKIQKITIVSKVIFDFTGYEIPIENISFGNKFIKIIASTGLKSEIYIKKKVILDKISKELPNIKIIDIK